MTAHQLAKALLNGPNLPVVINGWGSDHGFVYEAQYITQPYKTDVIRDQTPGCSVCAQETEVIALTYWAKVRP